MCPSSHPYAFQRGTNCCSSEIEDSNIATFGEYCDGGELSIFSMCCNGNQTPCPNGNTNCINQGNSLRI